MLAKDFLALDKISGNYLLAGDDAYLRDKVVSKLKSMLPEGIVEFNFNVLEYEKDSAKRIVDTLNLAPAFSDIRVVYVRDFLDKILKDDLNILKDYLANPNPTSVLVLNDEKGYCTSLKKSVTIIDLSSYTGNDAIDFVKTRASELGGAINHSGAKLLAEYCAYDMMRIDQELRKLIEFKEGASIGEVDVADLVHADVEYETYEIANAVGDKNMNRALEVIHTLIEAGLKPNDVIFQLSRTFRRMLYIKLSPLSDADIGNILEIKPFAVSKIRSRLGKFSPKKLKDIYDNVNEMEFKFKSGVMTDSSALDDALVKIFV